MPATDGPPRDLVRHVAGSTGLPIAVAARVVADVIAYFGETTDEYVRRRHAELRGRGHKNAEIWAELADELAARPVRAGALTERQLRRLVYG
ncbi:hypothetical protein HLB23_38950 [Nocardia uniformis]|uniref:Uncharacterized protein n=1 Tax=Nocardia uniformis TaxID=53432 RepID=A0A849CG23_9NOCA|nr:hypothetical protein [Nocardia uniformis]NNH75765.1 hypothetical protein [Nocardia uniformis]